jgi:hypothetical protein
VLRILLLLDAPDSSVAGGEPPIGCARFKKSYFLIKCFFPSNSAGANFNLATRIVCAVYSAVPFIGFLSSEKESEWDAVEYM